MAAGVSGLDVGVGLDEPGQLLGGAAAFVARRDRLAEGGDAPRRGARGAPACEGAILIAIAGLPSR